MSQRQAQNMPESEQAKHGARSAEGPSPASNGGMEPAGICRNPRCEWNQPEPLMELIAGAPAGWTWPHCHEGQAIVLLYEIG